MEFLDKGQLLVDSFENFRKKYDEKSVNYLENLQELSNSIGGDITSFWVGFYIGETAIAGGMEPLIFPLNPVFQ